MGYTGGGFICADNEFSPRTSAAVRDRHKGYLLTGIANDL